MDKLLEALFRQPLLLLLVGAWLVGVVANALKAQKKAKEKREAALRPSKVEQSTPEPTAPARAAAKQKGPGEVVGSLGTGQRAELPERRNAPASMRGAQKPVMPAQQPAAKKATTPDEIAAEMRRIFGLEPKPTPKPKPVPATPPRRPEPVRIEAESELIDPRSVRVRSSEPPLRSRVDSHVGEKARDRHLAESKVGKARGPRGAIGNLGGRVSSGRRQKDNNRRFPLADLRKIIVMNEILSPPVAMRDPSEERFRF